MHVEPSRTGPPPPNFPNFANTLLVSGIPTSLKNMKVSWGSYSQYISMLYIYGKITNVPNHQPVCHFSKERPFVGENPIYVVMEHNQSHQPNHKHPPKTMLS
jgi:hypothetical protein